MLSMTVPSVYALWVLFNPSSSKTLQIYCKAFIFFLPLYIIFVSILCFGVSITLISPRIVYATWWNRYQFFKPILLFIIQGISFVYPFLPRTPTLYLLSFGIIFSIITLRQYLYYLPLVQNLFCMIEGSFYISSILYFAIAFIQRYLGSILMSKIIVLDVSITLFSFALSSFLCANRCRKIIQFIGIISDSSQQTISTYATALEALSDEVDLQIYIRGSFIHALPDSINHTFISFYISRFPKSEWIISYVIFLYSTYYTMTSEVYQYFLHMLSLGYLKKVPEYLAFQLIYCFMQLSSPPAPCVRLLLAKYREAATRYYLTHRSYWGSIISDSNTPECRNNFKQKADYGIAIIKCEAFLNLLLRNFPFVPSAHYEKSAFYADVLHDMKTAHESLKMAQFLSHNMIEKLNPLNHYIIVNHSAFFPFWDTAFGIIQHKDFTPLNPKSSSHEINDIKNSETSKPKSHINKDNINSSPDSLDSGKHLHEKESNQTDLYFNSDDNCYHFMSYKETFDDGIRISVTNYGKEDHVKKFMNIFSKPKENANQLLDLKSSSHLGFYFIHGISILLFIIIFVLFSLLNRSIDVSRYNRYRNFISQSIDFQSHINALLFDIVTLEKIESHSFGNMNLLYIPPSGLSSAVPINHILQLLPKVYMFSEWLNNLYVEEHDIKRTTSVQTNEIQYVHNVTNGQYHFIGYSSSELISVIGTIASMNLIQSQKVDYKKGRTIFYDVSSDFHLFLIYISKQYTAKMEKAAQELRIKMIIFSIIICTFSSLFTYIMFILFPPVTHKLSDLMTIVLRSSQQAVLRSIMTQFDKAISLYSGQLPSIEEKSFPQPHYYFIVSFLSISIYSLVILFIAIFSSSSALPYLEIDPLIYPEGTNIDLAYDFQLYEQVNRFFIKPHHLCYHEIFYKENKSEYLPIIPFYRAFLSSNTIISYIYRACYILAIIFFIMYIINFIFMERLFRLSFILLKFLPSLALETNPFYNKYIKNEPLSKKDIETALSELNYLPKTFNFFCLYTFDNKWNITFSVGDLSDLVPDFHIISRDASDNSFHEFDDEQDQNDEQHRITHRNKKQFTPPKTFMDILNYFQLFASKEDKFDMSSDKPSCSLNISDDKEISLRFDKESRSLLIWDDSIHLLSHKHDRLDAKIKEFSVFEGTVESGITLCIISDTFQTQDLLLSSLPNTLFSVVDTRNKCTLLLLSTKFNSIEDLSIIDEILPYIFTHGNKGSISFGGPLYFFNSIPTKSTRSRVCGKSYDVTRLLAKKANLGEFFFSEDFLNHVNLIHKENGQTEQKNFFDQGEMKSVPLSYDTQVNAFLYPFVSSNSIPKFNI